MLASSRAQIGHLDAKAATVMSKLGLGEEARGVVKSVYAPEEKDNPRVTIVIE